MTGRLASVPSEIKPFQGLPAESVVKSNESLEVVNKFFYLGDISPAGGVAESIVASIRCG